jgi:hypothetical protein
MIGLIFWFLGFWGVWIVFWKVVFAAMDMTASQFVFSIFLAMLGAAAVGYVREKIWKK